MGFLLSSIGFRGILWSCFIGALGSSWHFLVFPLPNQPDHSTIRLEVWAYVEGFTA